MKKEFVYFIDGHTKVKLISDFEELYNLILYSKRIERSKKIQFLLSNDYDFNFFYTNNLIQNFNYQLENEEMLLIGKFKVKHQIDTVFKIYKKTKNENLKKIAYMSLKRYGYIFEDNNQITYGLSENEKLYMRDTSFINELNRKIVTDTSNYILGELFVEPDRNFFYKKLLTIDFELERNFDAMKIDEIIEEYRKKIINKLNNKNN